MMFPKDFEDAFYANGANSIENEQTPPQVVTSVATETPQCQGDCVIRSETCRPDCLGYPKVASEAPPPQTEEPQAAISQEISRWRGMTNPVSPWQIDWCAAQIEKILDTAAPEPSGPSRLPHTNSVKEKQMTFGEAVSAMKDGKMVQRAGWNGKNMHIYLEEGFTMCKGRGTERTYEPVICMFNAQGKRQRGWLANQPDILADDWQVVREAGGPSRLRALDLEIREIRGHLCAMEKEYPITVEAIRNNVKRLEALVAPVSVEE